MGRLYTKSFMNEETIGYFSNGKVTRGDGSLFSDISTIVYYQGGWIYVKTGISETHTIAKCDEYGNIYADNGGGSVLAKCENGIIYNGNHYGKKEIARYEGDMYGAAAAVAALILNLTGTESESQPEETQSTQSKPNSENTEQNDSDTNSVLAILGTIAAVISAFFMMLLAFSLTPLLCAAFLFIFAMGNPLLLLGAIGGIFVFVMRRRKKLDEAVSRKAAILQNAIWLICTLGGYFTGGILWLLAPAGTIAMFIYVAIATKRSAK